MALIECVPNLSEGRRTDVINRLVDTVRRVDEVRVLDVSSDGSHNRSVITLVGSAPSLHTAVLALYQQAIATIDLRSHSGAHPRLGAVDVVPFIPIDGTAMRTCVTLREGDRCGDRVALPPPVFLYEEAATTSRRRGGPRSARPADGRPAGRSAASPAGRAPCRRGSAPPPRSPGQSSRSRARPG